MDTGIYVVLLKLSNFIPKLFEAPPVVELHCEIVLGNVESGPQFAPSAIFLFQARLVGPLSWSIVLLVRLFDSQLRSVGRSIFFR